MIELREWQAVHTPMGKAYTWAVIPGGGGADMIFVCIQRETGESRCWRACDIRHDVNETMGIRKQTAWTPKES